MRKIYLNMAVVLLATLGFAGSALAAGYVGVSVGQSKVDICSDLRGLGITSCDDSDTAYKLTGGYSFSDNLAVEVSYSDAGEVGGSFGGVSAKAEASAIAVSAVGSLPVAESFSVFARAGFARWDAKFSATGFGSDSDTGTDLLWGVGAAYSLTEQFGLRGEWERIDVDGDNVDVMSIGLTLSF